MERNETPRRDTAKSTSPSRGHFTEIAERASRARVLQAISRGGTVAQGSSQPPAVIYGSDAGKLATPEP